MLSFVHYSLLDGGPTFSRPTSTYDAAAWVSSGSTVPTQGPLQTTRHFGEGWPHGVLKSLIGPVKTTSMPFSCNGNNRGEQSGLTSVIKNRSISPKIKPFVASSSFTVVFQEYTRRVVFHGVYCMQLGVPLGRGSRRTYAPRPHLHVSPTLAAAEGGSFAHFPPTFSTFRLRTSNERTQYALRSV